MCKNKVNEQAMKPETSPPKEKKKNSPLIIYYVYTSCIQSIKHFDSIQTSIRLIASTILLATFVGIGFIFSAEHKILPVDAIFAVGLICTIGVLSITSLWHLDLIFYERLLISFFTEAYDMENRFAWLPKIHHNMLYGAWRQDKPKNIVFFYIGCGSTLIIAGGLTLTYLFLPYGLLAVIVTIISTIIILAIYSFLLKRKTHSVEEMLKKLQIMKTKIKSNGTKSLSL